MTKLATAAARLQRLAGGPLDAAVIFGSGLSDALHARFDGEAVPFAKLGLPRPAVAGHPGIARVGTWSGRRVVAFAGRVHLYEGYPARTVAQAVRLAAKAGARTLVLANAAGGLNEAFAPGDVMLVADHINLTGTHPPAGGKRLAFLDMTGAYAPRLRALASAGESAGALHEGVYAGVRGPAYETPAEARALRSLGADAVGMSLVIETIAARSLGLDVLALSLIANVHGGADAVSHADVLASARGGAERIALLVENVLAAF